MLRHAGARMMLLVAVIAAFAYASCADDAPDAPRPTSAPATFVASPVATADPAVSPSLVPPSPTATAVPLSIDDVRDAAEEFAEASFTATYAITGDRSQNAFTGGDMTLVHDAGRMQLDVRAQQGAGVLAWVFIDATPVRGFCLRQAGDLGLLVGVDPMAGVCFSADAGSETPGLLRQFGDLPAVIDSARAPERRTIAGIDALCADFGASDAPLRLCFGGGGTLLYFADPTGLTLEATAASDTADAAAFGFPYEVRDLPPP